MASARGLTRAAARRLPALWVGAVVTATTYGVIGAPLPAAAAPAPAPASFGYSGGEQTYAIPAGATALQVLAVGSNAGLGGAGAVVRATLPVNGMTSLFVEVGGLAPGWGGGGTVDLSQNAGGGASGVQTCSQNQSSCRDRITGDPGADPRLVVAGGAGGRAQDAGGNAGIDSVTGPGAGGDATDVESDNGKRGGRGGFKGQSGGAAGDGVSGFDGRNGRAGQGGDAHADDPDHTSRGGGGGGGWFGGGSGGGGLEFGGSGGAGSSYWIPAATGTSMSTNAGGLPSQVVITPVFPTATTVTSSVNPSNTGEAVTFTATVNPSGAGTVAFTAGGAAISGCAGVAVNSAGQAACTTSGLPAGTHAITAAFSGDSGAGRAVLLASSGSLSQVVNGAVGKTDQTINFPAPGPRTMGDPPFTVSATATSGLPVSFSIASGPCTISVATVTITGVGTCAIAANQGGNVSFNPAPQVIRNVVVSPPATSGPVAVNDSYNVTEDASFSVPAPGPLANDTGAQLSAVLVTNPAHGLLTFNANGSFTYFPARDYFGTDSFTYKARDASGAESAPATATLTISPREDTPDARDDVAVTDEDTAVVIDVVANDVDVDTPNSELRAVSIANVVGGTATLIDSRRAQFVPAPNNNSATNPGGFSFTYKAADGPRESNPAVVRVTVNPVNDAPVSADDAYALDEDTALSVPAPGVLANDGDIDGPPASAVLVTGPAHAASFSLNGDGSFAYTPVHDFHGADQFTYKVRDGAGAESGVATVRLTVNRVDDVPPVLSLPAPITVDATGATGAAVVNFTASATDENPLNPAVTCTPASGATFPIGTTTVNCSATDAAGNTGTGSFTVTVRDILPPVLSLPAPITVNAVGTTSEAPVSFTATATDDNPASRNPAVTCTPASGATFPIGSHTVNCSSTDLSGNTGTGSFTVTVRDILPPVLSLPAPITVNAVGTTSEAPVSFTATATDDNPASRNPAVTCTPASGATFPIGSHTVNCSSTDLSGNTGTGSFTVEVVDILPPVVTVPAPITVNATDPWGALVGFTATASDDDRRIPTPPVTCTPATGTAFAIGDTTVNCTATDLYGNVGSASFNVHVKGAAEQLADAVAASQGVGPGNAISSKVERAAAEFAAGKVDKACKALDDFIHQLETHTPKQVAPALSAKLIADARRIQNVMDC